MRTGADSNLYQTIVLLAAPRAIQKLIGIGFRGSTRSCEHASRSSNANSPGCGLSTHYSDHEAIQEAVVRFQQTHEPVHVSCLPVLIRAVLVGVVNNRPVPFLSQRRTLADLLAGTRMVNDMPRRGTRLRWRRR